MQALSNCRVQIPSQSTPGSTERLIQVTGPREGVQKVRQMLHAISLLQSSTPVMNGTYAQIQTTSNDYMGYNQAAAPAPATGADETYYEDFFRYEYYYGTEAARQQYGAWAPPVGTPNPYGTNPNGVTAPPPPNGQQQQGGGAAPAPAAYQTSTTQQQQGGYNQAPAPAAYQASAPAPAFVQGETYGGTSNGNSANSNEQARESSRRKVSNLPAWMTNNK